MFLMARNLTVFVVLVSVVAVVVLWAAFSYGGPAVLDKLDKAPGDLFGTTTTTVP